jgi:NADH:ubiquinone oxidoreductase subunit 5 (subunit L)/multisubunit Na+/H+ antiporter MnhA subunit
MGQLHWGFIHLIVHSWLKATIFLRFGYLIKSVGGEQNLGITIKAGNRAVLAIAVFCVAAIALSGFPFVGAYFTKEPISIFINNTNIWIFSSWFMYFGTFLSFVYTTRAVIIIWTFYRRITIEGDLEDKRKIFSLCNLCIWAIVSGPWIIYWLSQHHPKLIEFRRSVFEEIVVIICVGIYWGLAYKNRGIDFNNLKTHPWWGSFIGLMNFSSRVFSIPRYISGKWRKFLAQAELYILLKNVPWYKQNHLFTW